MIDFRYHLVSIVSIFLALAVGIVLGAGPLQGEIGDTLGREVAGLRQDKAQLNTQLQQSNATRDGLDAYIGETNPELLSGVLQNRRVAMVVLPGSDAAVAEATAAGLRAAGASVVSTTAVTDSWVSVDTSTAEARDAAVAQAATRTGVDVSETGAVAPRDVLLAALLTAPRQASVEPVAVAAAVEGLNLLSDADLIEVDTEGFQVADLVVVVSGVVTSGETDARATAAERWVDLSTAFDDHSAGTVVVAETSTAASGTSVLAAVRNDATATRGVSTVDNAGSALGQASVVYGLVQQAAGDAGQYGFAGGADAPYAPVPAP